MSAVALALFLAPVIVALYAYVLYPLVLWVIVRIGPADATPTQPTAWPFVSISVPVYNEALQIRSVIESLLAIDYPADRRQILIISDASTDGTDEIVAEYRSEGVELLRVPTRGGKTAGENAGASYLRGEIVVNTDASIRIRRDAIKALVRHFADASVGVASGRDISVGTSADANAAEGGYVGYEMAIRGLETRTGGIVGSSGCLYAIRVELHRQPLPGHLSRDFASALIAREYGYRAVSVDDAICFVPRTASLEREYRRKVRTMSRGMETLHHKRHLLNPFRHGAFAFKLISHKVCRWLVPPAAVLGGVGLAILSLSEAWAQYVALLTISVLSGAYVAWARSESQPMPRVIVMCAAALAANIAVLHSIARALRRDDDATWEPTRRETILPSGM